MYVVHRNEQFAGDKTGYCSVGHYDAFVAPVFNVVDVAAALTKHTLPSYALSRPRVPLRPRFIYRGTESQGTMCRRVITGRGEWERVLTQTNPFSSNKMSQGEWECTFGRRRIAEQSHGNEEKKR